MSIEVVKAYLSRWNRQDDILEFPVSSATVDLAAAALGVEPSRIAKTLAFQREDGGLVVVAAGHARIDNARFRAEFGMKARMLSFELTQEITGHAVGGVCPFGLPETVPVYLDVSLKEFTTVYPSGGSSNSAIELTIQELETYSNFTKWVDVCKHPEE